MSVVTVDKITGVTSTATGQTVALSSYPGVTGNAVGATSTSGLIDSRAAIVAAFAAYAGTKTEIIVDTPIYIAIGTDYTKSIFVPSNVNVRFTGSGLLYVDNIGTPVFVFENSSNSTFINAKFVYLANFGLPACLPTLSPFNPQSQINTIAISNYLVANFGNTFTSGGTPISATTTNNCTLIMIRGASNNLSFIGGSATVPAGVPSSNFIPMVFSLTPEWNANLTGITSGTTVTTANSTIPSNVTISGWTFDGTYMGIQGGAQNLVVRDLVSLRYSVLQDGTSGSVTFTGALSSGATTGTLAAPWAYPTGTYGLSFPMGATTATSGNGTTATITYSGTASFATNALINVTNVLPIGYNGWHVVTASSAGSVSFASAVTGSQTQAGTMAQFSFVPLTNASTATGTFAALGGTATSATAASGNLAGYGFWFSPPHLLYLDTTLLSPVSYPTSFFQIANVLDTGPYVGIATRPTTGYGTLLSLKIEPGNNSIIDGYTSLRPDGLMDILSFGVSGGVMRNIYGVFDSSIATSDSSTIWGIRWPSNFPYSQLALENITIIDSATTPTQFPVNPLSAAGSNNISIRGLKVFQKDYPVGATYNPTFVFLGDKINVQADVFFQACNSAQTGRGVFQNQGLVTNSNFDITVHGWQQTSITFTGTLSIGATTATLSTSWLKATGTYQITLSDAEVRYALLTNGATTVGAFVALTGNVTASAGAGGALAVNYANYKQRIFLADGGIGTGNFARIRDVSNGWEATVENGIQTERYTQMWAGTPTGATYTTPIVFPSTMAIEGVGYRIGTALDTGSGLTTVGVGVAGNPTALLAAQLATTSFAANPTFTPTTACGANAILLTPTAGSFGTTGLLQLSVRGSHSLGAN